MIGRVVGNEELDRIHEQCGLDALVIDHCGDDVVGGTIPQLWRRGRIRHAIDEVALLCMCWRYGML